MTQLVQSWICDGSVLRRPGLPVRGAGGRDSLVYGAYEPDETTTGHVTPEGELTEYNSPSVDAVTIPAGAVITSKIIHGDITFAGSAELRDCLLVGGNNVLASGNVGVLRCTNVRSGIAKLWDCTIRPRKESDGRDCALGWQFELYRCHLSRGVDGVGIYKTSAPYAAAVKVKGCLIEDLAFTYPDRDHSDGTHTDCIQIQGGTDIEIVGNSLRGTAHYMAGSGTFYTANPTASTGDWPVAKSGVTAGAGIIVEANVAPVDSSVIISQNWIRWCKAQLLIKASANGFVCTGNRLSSVNPPASNVSGSVVAGSPLNFTYNPYWCRFDSLSASGSVSGLTSGGALANTTNVWLDGPNAGQPLATPRANGVATDA